MVTNVDGGGAGLTYDRYDTKRSMFSHRVVRKTDKATEFRTDHTSRLRLDVEGVLGVQADRI